MFSEFILCDTTFLLEDVDCVLVVPCHLCLICLVCFRGVEFVGQRVLAPILVCTFLSVLVFVSAAVSPANSFCTTTARLNSCVAAFVSHGVFLS